MLALLGLKDTYRSDGRVLTEFISRSALPDSLADHLNAYQRLAAAYKQLDAGVGSFAAATLVASNRGVSSASAGDAQYTATEASLAVLGTARDDVAERIVTLLDGAAFHHRSVDPRQAASLEWQADQLIRQAQRLAAA
jgi:hypothetical protein